jgi:ABC-type transport system substrate-binding protein
MISDAKTLDPAQVSDLYSNYATALAYEGLLEYHYLKRPYELIPALAEAMPTVSKDGLTYTFKIKPGILFADHEAMPGGKGREVKAKDFVYSFLRVADPRNEAGNFWIFEGRIKGFDEWREAQKKLAATNFDTAPEGLKAVDDYTLQIQLTRPYPQLLFVLAMPQTFVVPREAVEKLGKDFGGTTVGTGPFKLARWMRPTRLSFVKNPSFRGQPYPTEGEESDKTNGNLADAGKTLPFVDGVELHVFVENQPMWLNLISGALDVARVTKDNFNQAMDPVTSTILPDLAAKGMSAHKFPQPEISYEAFNMDDPVIKKGGANLRKAISLALDKRKSIELFFNNQAILGQSPVPPDFAGYDPNFKNPYAEYDVEKAKEYLAKAGFPGGKGLKLAYETTQGTDSRQQAEKLQADLAKIGVNIQINVNSFPELTEKINKGRAQMWGIAWGADYPDAENFFQLLYCKNKAPGPNGANYCNPAYDKLYEKMAAMQDSPERRKIIRQMQDLFVQDLPWIVERHRIFWYLTQPWTKNYKAGYMGATESKYLRIDTERRKQGLK